jgi:hypothetical protein
MNKRNDRLIREIPESRSCWGALIAVAVVVIAAALLPTQEISPQDVVAQTAPKN